MADATVKLSTIATFFRKPGEGLAAFTKEWKDLPDKDKDQVKAGFADGSMTY